MLTLTMLVLLSQRIQLQDEGVNQGYVGILNCSGESVTCTKSGGVGTLEITGGGSGGLPDGGDISGAAYVTFSAETALTAERVLSAGNYNAIDLGTAAQAQVDWIHGLTCSAGQALTSASTSTMACTSTITASDLVCAGTCVADAEIAAVAASKLTGTVAAARGGLGAAQPTCSAGAYLTCNGTTCSCAAPANAVEAIVDFGTGSDTASVVVTGLTWVATTSKITCAVTMVATADRAEGVEDAIIEDLSVGFHTRVAGTGFTLVAHPASGIAYGKYAVHCIGV